MIVPEHRKEWSIYADELPDFWDRTKVPSVSQVLAWKFGGPPDVPNVHIALDRGQKIHRALQFYDEADLHWQSIRESAEMMQYVLTWSNWVTPGDEFLAIEKPLYGEIAGINYIVRPDRVMRRGAKVWVVDLKTKSKVGRPPSQQEQLQHALEVAAQRLAVAQRLGPASDVTGCLYLWPTKAQFLEYGSYRYIDEFTEILVAWKEAQQQEQAQAVG